MLKGEGSQGRSGERGKAYGRKGIGVCYARAPISHKECVNTVQYKHEQTKEGGQGPARRGGEGSRYRRGSGAGCPCSGPPPGRNCHRYARVLINEDKNTRLPPIKDSINILAGKMNTHFTEKRKHNKCTKKPLMSLATRVCTLKQY